MTKQTPCEQGRRNQEEGGATGVRLCNQIRTVVVTQLVCSSIWWSADEAGTWRQFQSLFLRDWSINGFVLFLLSMLRGYARLFRLLGFIC